MLHELSIPPHLPIPSHPIPPHPIPSPALSTQHNTQAIFPTLPRHPYAELCRSHDGIIALSSRNTIATLLATALPRASQRDFQPKPFSRPKPEHSRGGSGSGSGSGTASGSAGMEEQRAALWGLGHLASTEFGFTASASLEPDFVERCVCMATSAPVYSLRATAFQVLGLISRSSGGRRKLSALGWDCSAAGRSFAVAVPRDPAVLFATEIQPLPDPGMNVSSAVAAAQLVLGVGMGGPQFLPGGSEWEIEVLSLISKVRALAAISAALPASFLSVSVHSLVFGLSSVPTCQL